MHFLISFPAVFVHKIMDWHRIAGETWRQVDQPCLETSPLNPKFLKEADSSDLKTFF